MRRIKLFSCCLANSDTIGAASVSAILASPSGHPCALRVPRGHARLCHGSSTWHLLPTPSGPIPPYTRFLARSSNERIRHLAQPGLQRVHRPALRCAIRRVLDSTEQHGACNVHTSVSFIPVEQTWRNFNSGWCYCAHTGSRESPFTALLHVCRDYDFWFQSLWRAPR